MSEHIIFTRFMKVIGYFNYYYFDSMCFFAERVAIDDTKWPTALFISIDRMYDEVFFIWGKNNITKILENKLPITVFCTKLKIGSSWPTTTQLEIWTTHSE